PGARIPRSISTTSTASTPISRAPISRRASFTQRSGGLSIERLDGVPRGFLQLPSHVGIQPRHVSVSLGWRSATYGLSRNGGFALFTAAIGWTLASEP